MKDWFLIQNIETIDSPSIVLYEDRLIHNLHKMLDMVGNDTSKLMPHIKTNKMPKVIDWMISLGLKNFKASTIAEAEVAANQGANSVLIAHQLVGPKVLRFATLIEQFPKTQFTTIVDNLDSIKILHEIGIKENIEIGIYVDVNSGMNRSGVQIGTAMNLLLAQLSQFNTLIFKGLHVYDGHLRESNFQKRKNKIECEFKPIEILFDNLRHEFPEIQLICGGTPAFTSHLTESNRIFSPGTCVFWDWGYAEKLKEQKFKYAVLIITRVISKPIADIITIDLGHKSVAAENPIDKRIKFLNLDNYKVLSQSEEHGVLQVKNWDSIKIGDVYFGVPYHICPTINLHDEVSVINVGKKVDSWKITARKRKITI